MLVVAATQMELSFDTGANTLVCGIGPVEATLATARALASSTPDGVLHIGIAGARSLPPGSLVLGTESVYCDLTYPGSTVPKIVRIEPDSRLLQVARSVLPAAAAEPIATSASVGGGHVHCEIEAMEGFGVLRAAAAAGVPALELRAISNSFDDERAAWRVDDALAALARAVPALLEAFGA
jgi:nucleoside phosphorylase